MFDNVKEIPEEEFTFYSLKYNIGRMVVIVITVRHPLMQRPEDNNYCMFGKNVDGNDRVTKLHIPLKEIERVFRYGEKIFIIWNDDMLEITEGANKALTTGGTFEWYLREYGYLDDTRN